MTRRSQIEVYIPTLEFESLPSILGSGRDAPESSEGSDDLVDPGDPLWWAPTWYRRLLEIGMALAVVAGVIHHAV